MSKANLLLVISSILLAVAVYIALDSFDQFRAGSISPLEFVATLSGTLVLSRINFVLSKKARCGSESNA